MPEATLAQRLAEFAAAARAEGLPEPVAASVRERVLDVVGLCAAAVPLGTSAAVLGMVREAGGAPQAQVVGLAAKVPAAQAAFANGVLAHSLDFDDTHLPSVLHPSASVVPAALAAAELHGASGLRLVAAVAAGLEVCVRLGVAGYDEAAGNSLFFEHGQHATSICGALGAAVAAASLGGLDPGGIASALGVAASMAGGVLEANRTGGTVKRLHCGFAAHAGVLSAELARRGVSGPPTALEGRFGFFEAFLHGRYDAVAVTGELGERWEVPGIHFKPYPANHFTHAGIDAALALRRRGLDPGRAQAIHLGVPTATVRTIGEPLETKRAPQTGYQAQFSGPYTLVAALLGGGGLGLGLDDFSDELARDPRRRELMARVTVTGDPDCDALYPRRLPAVLRVETDRGEVLVERVLANRGGPERPLSGAELAAKFAANARRLVPGEVADQVAAEVARLPELERVATVLQPLAKDW